MMQFKKDLLIENARQTYLALLYSKEYTKSSGFEKYMTRNLRRYSAKSITSLLFLNQKNELASTQYVENLK